MYVWGGGWVRSGVNRYFFRGGKSDNGIYGGIKGRDGRRQGRISMRGKW